MRGIPSGGYGISRGTHFINLLNGNRKCGNIIKIMMTGDGKKEKRVIIKKKRGRQCARNEKNDISDKNNQPPEIRVRLPRQDLRRADATPDRSPM